MLLFGMSLGLAVCLLAACGNATFERAPEQSSGNLAPKSREPEAWYLSASSAIEPAKNIYYSTELSTAQVPQNATTKQAHDTLVPQFAERKDTPKLDKKLDEAGLRLLASFREGRAVPSFFDFQNAAHQVGFAGVVLAGAMGNCRIFLCRLVQLKLGRAHRL
ncbi:MAG TPA: hypothetical protein VIV60_06990 [Polyangiaceae bacterium]